MLRSASVTAQIMTFVLRKQGCRTLLGELPRMEIPVEPSPKDSLLHPRWRMPRWATVSEALVFLCFSVFFLVYGTTPLVGGDGLGLVGADEPRYAQIAHEMLVRFDSAHTLSGRLSACVTPYLYGRPWLEKPALYYWRAMFVFQDFGVHDWAARLPSASFAFIMVGLIYLHMKRFRPGGHLDAALITVACVGIMAFSRGASTDMQMAAPLSIGLLGWYAWYETNSKFWLYDIYFFTGLATLAKGPVAPLLAALIIVAFAFLRKEWRILPRSLWWPGVVLYFAMVLPWFIAVQHQNPTFFREFFLEHNLQRFATDRYQHAQPFWYYFVVAVLALMPWAVIAIRALIDGIMTSVAEWRLRHSRAGKPLPTRPGDAFPEFLVLWSLIPIVFFSFSQSKLPGYILPAIPPITILTGDYLFRRRQPGLNRWILLGHAVVCGVTALVVLLLPWFVVHGAQMPPAHALTAASMAGVGAALLILVVTRGFGVIRLRTATCGILVVLVLFIYGAGPAFGIPGIPASKRVIHLLDRTYSARPLAEQLGSLVPADETVAVFRVRRDIEYGLSFYRNREVVNYEESGVPDEQHVLVARVQGKHGADLETQAALEEYLEGRRYEPLFRWPEQGLEIYLVGSR
ncbi:Dolichyl-phosphate-mannose-protein mannosyltransferase family protein [Candidatus Sulfotelmatomonas gaucii]|uniref:Dolichyl-phosphate-mannose-protein mannosyltransferase family protein n=1 Tax=Candidatus Sulfuritelmatomonas gaucii TaxID=2043161 RepID=A0A2N9L4I7_9BACT|nr:Dolichyl-phosphate-mannose-protein mannosyltransferase family protein [Candidatus Sulfotelmatomonas gaucii]